MEFNRGESASSGATPPGPLPVQGEERPQSDSFRSFKAVTGEPNGRLLSYIVLYIFVRIVFILGII